MSAAIAIKYPCGFCGGPQSDENIGAVAFTVNGKGWCGACEKGHSARRAAVWSMRDEARIPENYENLDEDVYPRCHNDERAIARIEAWARSSSVDAQCLTITGATGFGKTTLAAFALVSFIDADNGSTRARWIDVDDLALARRNAPLGDEAKLVKIARQRGIVVLDDLGSETEDKTRALEHVIMKRYARNLVTIATTWLTPEQIREKYGGGIKRRLLERALVIDLRGPR